MSERWQQTLVGFAIGLILLGVGWMGTELRSLRSEMTSQFGKVEQRLDTLEQNQAVLLNRMGRVEHDVEILLNRTVPRVPVAAKQRK